MLRAEQLSQLVDAKIVPVYQQIEDDLLRSIARRLSAARLTTASALWEIRKAQDMSLLYDDLKKAIQKHTSLSAEAVTSMLKRAGADSVSYDAKIYERAAERGYIPSAAIPPQIAAYMDAQLQAAAQAAIETAKLTNTRAIQGALNEFSATVDRAYLAVSSGLSSADVATRQALREFAAAGVKTVNYASGRSMSIEAATRMNMITATNQACARLAETHIQAMGANLVETTSHAGARPEHAEWQGRVFWVKTPQGKYKEFASSTGYGTASGLCGVNCRHSFFPYFENISSKSFDRDPAQELGIDNDVLYEQTQQQRKLERKIRAAKRENVMAEAAKDSELSVEASVRVRAAQRDMRSFLSDKPHLTRYYLREAV